MKSDNKKGGDKKPSNYDYTGAIRIKRRREALNQYAQSLGFSGWSQFETTVLNNKELQAAIAAAVADYLKE